LRSFFNVSRGTAGRTGKSFEAFNLSAALSTVLLLALEKSK
jgi:hypothetical protein